MRLHRLAAQDRFEAFADSSTVRLLKLSETAHEVLVTHNHVALSHSLRATVTETLTCASASSMVYIENGTAGS